MTQKQRSIFEYVSTSKLKSTVVNSELDNDKSIEIFLCPLCLFDLTKFNLNARTVHINRCIDPPLGNPQLLSLKKKRKNNTEKELFEKSTIKKKKVMTDNNDDHDDHNGVNIKSEIVKTELEESQLTKDELIMTSSVVIDDEGEIESKIIEVKKEEKPIVKKRKGKPKPPIPFEKILQFNEDIDNILAVDAFCYAPDEKIKLYLLTHFHSDHYGGLCKSWDNGEIIICTKITSNLIIEKFKFPSEKIFILENYGEMIDIPNSKLRISVFDANHCPGAGIYVIEHKDFQNRYLHCGDFRANDTMINELINKYNKEFDKCYLDTTYLNPTYTFANQQDVVNYTSEWIKNKIEIHKSKQQRIVDFFYKPGKNSKIKEFLVIIGTYSIGKEKLAIGISNALNTKIYCSKAKYDILKQYNWKELEDKLDSENDMDCGIHLLPISKTKKEYLLEYFKKYSTKYKSILVFIPTGWTFGYGKSGKDSTLDLTLKDSMFKLFESGFNVGGSKGNLVIIRKIMVPYSEHSSYTDLTNFIRRVPVKEWIPTVNMKRFQEQVDMIGGIVNGEM